LRARGHAITFCCGPPAADALRARGEAVVEVPAPHEVVKENRVRLLASARRNAPLAVRTPEIVNALAERIEALKPEGVVADFEPFAPRAAKRLGLPCVALDHQHVLSEARCRVPLRYAPAYALTRLGIGVMAPRRLYSRIVIPTFFFPPLRRGSRARLVPPVLRADVREVQPSEGERVLVYVNHPAGSERLLAALSEAGAPCTVYGIPAPERIERCPNLRFAPPSRGGFLRDLAAARAVVCTAGFTLISEALHLGKPLLVLPNRGFFEQAINALYLRQRKWGEAVIGRALRADDLRGFLRRLPSAAPGGPTGNAEAAAAVEAAL
ncbi:MAG: glycosyltransferase family protein, partial [Rhodothermales bacterium]|nr:glycosyltransferase family protein [Rhodothermales bacterium]